MRLYNEATTMKVVQDITNNLILVLSDCTSLLYRPALLAFSFSFSFSFTTQRSLYLLIIRQQLFLHNRKLPPSGY